MNISELAKFIESELKRIGIEDSEAAAETELILLAVTKRSRADRFREPQFPIDAEVLASAKQILSRRAVREPLQYILGETYFYGLRFELQPGVLIPRADTEILVDAAISYYKKNLPFTACKKKAAIDSSIENTPSADIIKQGDSGSSMEFDSEKIRTRKDDLIISMDSASSFGAASAGSASVENSTTTCLRLAEIGVGSGIISVCVLKHLPSAKMEACDISERAIAVTRENADLHGVGVRLSLECCDWKKWWTSLEKPLDGLLSNPPYIPKALTETLAPEVREHEPALALFGEDEDGLGFYRDIAELPATDFSVGARIFLEIGAEQANSVADIFYARGWDVLDLLLDLNGIARVMCIRPKTAPFEQS